MPLNIIKGHYRIQGSEPDGDSVHFHPSDPEAFAFVRRLTEQLHPAVRGHTAAGSSLRHD